MNDFENFSGESQEENLETYIFTNHRDESQTVIRATDREMAERLFTEQTGLEAEDPLVGLTIEAPINEDEIDKFKS